MKSHKETRLVFRVHTPRHDRQSLCNSSTIII